MKNSDLFQLSFQFLVNYENQEIVASLRENILKNEALLFKFIRLSSNHLVLPAIYRRLQKTGLSDELPDELSLHLNEILQQNIKRNEEILQQINEINEALLPSNIQPIYLKGTANLMDNLYSEIGDRMIGDIDFLVLDDVYLKTAEIVKNLGYKTETKFYDDVKKIKDYPRLFRDDVPADVEIHRVPVEIPFSGKFSAEMIFKKKKAVNNKENCYIACDAHKITHTFIHSQLSNQGYRFKQIGLRDLYDFHLLSKRINLIEVIETIEEKKKAKIFADYVLQLESPKDHLKMEGKIYSKTFRAYHEWFYNHPKQHYFYINSLKLYDLIFKRYIGRILKALIQKKSFNYIYNRMKDPKWYKYHIEGILTSFKH